MNKGSCFEILVYIYGMAPKKAHLCVDMVKSSPKILSLRYLAVYVDVFYCFHFPVDMLSQCFSHNWP